MAVKRYRIDFRVVVDLSVVVESPLPSDRFGEDEALKAISAMRLEVKSEGGADIDKVWDDEPIISEIQPETEE